MMLANIYKMRTLTNEIDKILQNVLLSRGGQLLVDLNTNWEMIIGQQLHKTTYPIKIIKQYDKNILYIGASNSVASLEVNLQQQEIIDRITIKCGYKAIHGIKCLIFLATS